VRLSLKALPAVHGRFKVVVKGKNGNYTGNLAHLPLNATVVIDRPYATTGQCGARPGTCTTNAAGTSVRCR
jgi:hypothetical protein